MRGNKFDDKVFLYQGGKDYAVVKKVQQGD